MNDLEDEVQRTIRKVENYRENHAPTDYCDDVLACAGGTLLHQQAMLRKQDDAIKTLREALGEIEWSNDSKWQADRANAALAATEET